MKIKYALLLLCSCIAHSKCDNGMYRHAAVTANGIKCARVGRQIMEQGGSVADAAIATMLCDGITSSERMGIGGGFLMTIYNRAAKKTEVLIARESAPAAANKDMYKNNSDASLYGGLAVAVPGEVKGYWELHKRYGKLPWGDLFQPAIKLCEEGVEAEPFVTRCIMECEAHILKSPSLKEIFGNFCRTFSNGKPKIYRPQLAKTLNIIAQQGPDALYNGVLTSRFVQDIKDQGGIITKEDLINYKSHWVKPLSMNFLNGMVAYTVPPPGSGAVLLLILNILAGFMPIQDNKTSWNQIIESWKYAYGFRTKLGDQNFTKNVSEIVDDMLCNDTAEKIRKKITSRNKTECDFRYYGGVFFENKDTGTAHLNLVHPNGDAIAVTSTINSLFGAMFRSESTGIILNNHMNDFSLPGNKNKYGLYPSPANYIEPGKRPLSSICPTIIVNKRKDVQMAAGGAGGSKIITAISMVIFNHLMQNINVRKTIADRRLHHQLLPMRIQYEEGFDNCILEYLKHLGHETEEMPKIAVVSSITRSEEGLCASADYRRTFSTDGF